MGRLNFKSIFVRRVVEHALGATDHEPLVIGYDVSVKPITEPGQPAVILVQDYGVYLMSNGKPRDIFDEGTGRSYVAYAEGCDPNLDREWRKTSAALVGGDDFGRTLPWAKEIKEMIDTGVQEIVIEFGDDSTTLVEPPLPRK
jgi:hypothetical protein